MNRQMKINDRRRQRVRTKVRSVAGLRPRLSVFRSSQHIYAQIIDDKQGRTLVSVGTVEKDLRGKLKRGCDIAAAQEAGRLLAERAKAAGVTEVVFDRGSRRYHGRVKALAEAAREGGLSF